jgi:hypothetical protein
MIKQDNPAGRLHSLLLALKSQPGSTSMRKAWAAAFGLPEPDVIGIYSNLVRLTDSLGEIEKDIGLQDVDTDIFLQHMPQLRQLMSISNLDNPLHAHLALLNEGVL